jgi:hypothetical protein
MCCAILVVITQVMYVDTFMLISVPTTTAPISRWTIVRFSQQQKRVVSLVDGAR